LLIDKVEIFDKYEGMRLRLQRAFGMRLKESIMFKPSHADKGTHVVLTDGTKGDRSRVVPVDSEEQRSLLEKAKLLANNKAGYLGSGGRTLKQAMRRFRYVMQKFGITHDELGFTPHGLRHEYANDRYEEISGSESPVRNPNIDVDQAIDIATRQTLTEELGHTRINIVTAYSGIRKITSKPRMNWSTRFNNSDDDHSK
jgi:integrase